MGLKINRNEVIHLQSSPKSWSHHEETAWCQHHHSLAKLKNRQAKKLHYQNNPAVEWRLNTEVIMKQRGLNTTIPSPCWKPGAEKYLKSNDVFTQYLCNVDLVLICVLGFWAPKHRLKRKAFSKNQLNVINHPKYVFSLFVAFKKAVFYFSFYHWVHTGYCWVTWVQKWK